MFSYLLLCASLEFDTEIDAGFLPRKVNKSWEHQSPPVISLAFISED
jgi:hypothetical protein